MDDILFRQTESSDPLQAIGPWIDYITPEIVINKDGSILAAFSYEGIDPVDSFDAYIDAKTGQLQNAYSQLDEHVMAWWIVDKRETDKYEFGEFENETAKEVDLVYSKSFTNNKHYVIRSNLYLLYTGQSGSVKLLDRISQIRGQSNTGMVQAFLGALKESLSDRAAFNVHDGVLSENISKFERIITNFKSNAPLTLRRLNEDSITSALSLLLNRANDERQLHKPKNCMLDSWLPNNYVSTRKEIMQFRGNTKSILAACLGVKWPDETSPRLFEDLLTMEMEMTFCHIIRFLGRDASLSEIQKAIEYYELTQFGMIDHSLSKLGGKEPTPKPGKSKLLAEAKEARELVASEGVNFAYQNISVFVYAANKNDLKLNVDSMCARFAATKFEAVRERENIGPSYAAMLPGQWNMQTRYELVSIANAADVTPIFTLEQGSKVHKFFTEKVCMQEVPAFTKFTNAYKGITYFSPHVGQVGHMLIIAPTNTGKTTFVNFCLSQFKRYPNSKIFIFDRDRSCETVTKLHGGTHISLQAKSNKLNPFFALSDGSPDGKLWLREFFLNRMREGNFEPKAVDRQKIDDAIEELIDAKMERTIRGLCALLPSYLSEQLVEWERNGAFGMFDNDVDEFDLSNWTAIEMNEIMKVERLSRAFMEYAFRKIYVSLDGSPTFIYLEEAKFLLEDERFKEMIADWLTTLRKKNAFVWMTVQSPTVITSSTIAATITDNVMSFLFLYNKKLESHREAYSKYFGLDDHQIDLIGKLKVNRDYLLVQDGKARVLVTEFSPELLCYLRSEKACLNILDRVYQRDNLDWKQQYLDEVIHVK